MRNTLDLCITVAGKQLAAVEAFMAGARAALVDDPPAGSYAAQVNDFAHSLKAGEAQDTALFVWLQLGNGATKALWNVRDHSIAFDAAIRDPRRPTTSLMTLVRSMLEGTLMVSHLLEPVGPRLTLARGMAHWIDTMEGTLLTVRRLPEGIGPEPEALEETIREAYVDFGKGGFTTVQGKNPLRSAHVLYKGEKAIVDMKVVDLAKQFLSSEPHLYPILSGPAHSKNWFLGGAFQLGDEPGDFATYEQSWVSALTFALDISDLLVKTVAAVLSMDAADYLKHTHVRRRALLASMDGGRFSPMSYEDFMTTPYGKRGGGGGQAFGLNRHP